MNTNKLIEILSIQSCSYKQQRIVSYITKTCKALNVAYKSDQGNIYITKGKASSYPCIVAHMDTVHPICEDLTVLNIYGNLTGFNSVRMKQTGIGGDDKVGIFIALECLRIFDNIKIAFFKDEETGCEGSYNADVDFFNNCNFVLQCDRQKNKDFITNASCVELSSEQFQEDVAPIIKRFGYSFNDGMMTDVMALKELGINCSMANISCGYYNPHSANEYVNIKDVENCLQMVTEIIKVMGDNSYEHIYETYDYYDGIDDRYYDNRSAGSTSQIKLDECDACLDRTPVNELKYIPSYNMYVCPKCCTLAHEDEVREYKPKNKKMANSGDELF
jgi:hypothetical protein